MAWDYLADAVRSCQPLPAAAFCVRCCVGGDAALAAVGYQTVPILHNMLNNSRISLYHRKSCIAIIESKPSHQNRRNCSGSDLGPGSGNPRRPPQARRTRRRGPTDLPTPSFFKTRLEALFAIMTFRESRNTINRVRYSKPIWTNE